MIRLAPLITADVDTTTLPGGKASDAAQDFLALLSEALAGETTTDKAAPQLLVATDKPTTKGEPLVSEILADAQQADLLIPVDETPPVINDEQSTSTPLTTAQTMTLAAVAGNNTAKDEKADDLNEDVTASLSALFAMLPGFDNTPKVTDAPSTVLPTEKPTLFTKLTSAQLTTAQPDDAPGTPAQPLTPLVAEAQSKAEVISTPSPVTAAASPLITPHQTQPLPTVAAPVLSAPLGSHEWQQSLSQHISLFTRQGQQSAELRLHPQDLGEVQISLKVDDNQAQIQMVSPHQHVRAALEAALPVLRTQLAETGKTGSGNDDHVRHCPIITCQRCSCFFVLCSVAGRAADPDRHCAWFYHAICLCRCTNRWRNYRSANGAVICDVCRSGQPSQYARFSAYHGYAGVTAVPDI